MVHLIIFLFLDGISACFLWGGVWIWLIQRFKQAKFIPLGNAVANELKFQIEFRERYDLNLRLSENILYMIYNLDKTKEQQMIEYTKSKAGSIDLQNKYCLNIKN